MNDLNFTWDKSKETINIRKHGVSFEEARSVFSDEKARLIADPDHSESEDRFILLGYSSGLRLLIVCHCYLSDDNVIRIFSARKATRREATFYTR